VRDRNQDEQVSLVVAEDPGLPNLVVVGNPAGTGNGGQQLSRSVTWTPVCEQSRNYSIEFRAAAAGLVTAKRFMVEVVSPKPQLMGFDNSAKSSVVDCWTTIKLVGADADSMVRASLNPFYEQQFFPGFERVTTNGTVVPINDYSTLFDLEVIPDSGTNQYGGKSATLRYRPKLEASGGRFKLCVTVKDRCNVRNDVVEKVDVTVLRCMVCAEDGHTLSKIGKRFGTDGNSMYASNPSVKNPDMLLPGQHVNIGGTYKTRPDDTVSSIQSRFLTNAASLQLVNPDLVPGSSTLPSELCIVPNVCGVSCSPAGGCAVEQFVAIA